MLELAVSPSLPCPGTLCAKTGARALTVWLGREGVIPPSNKSPVQFLVRAWAWVLGSVPSWGAYERQPINVSLSLRFFSPLLSPSLPTLKINNILKQEARAASCSPQSRFMEGLCSSPRAPLGAGSGQDCCPLTTEPVPPDPKIWFACCPAPYEGQRLSLSLLENAECKTLPGATCSLPRVTGVSGRSPPSVVPFRQERSPAQRSTY